MTAWTHGERAAPSWRVPVVSAEVAAFGVLAHASAGGGLTNLVSFAALALLMAPVCLALRHRLLRLPAAAAVAAAGQLAVHYGTTAAGQLSPAVGHHDHLGQGTGADLLSPMLLAHAISAVATVLALVWQEQVLVGAVRCVRRWFTVPAAPERPSLAVPVADGPMVVDQQDATTLQPRRGPPAHVLAA